MKKLRLSLIGMVFGLIVGLVLIPGTTVAGADPSPCGPDPSNNVVCIQETEWPFWWICGVYDPCWRCNGKPSTC